MADAYVPQVNPAGTPATVQPGASTSLLRSMTQAEATKIQNARDANYGVSTSAPQLLSNPRTQTNAAGVEQKIEPTGGGVNQVAPSAPSAPTSAPPAPQTSGQPAPTPGAEPSATDQAPIATGLSPQERAAITQTMQGFTDTMGGMWDKVQELYKGFSKTPFNFDQYRQPGQTEPGIPGVTPPPTPPGQAPGQDTATPRVGAEIGFDKATGIPAQGQVPMAPGGTMDLFAKQNAQKASGTAPDVVGSSTSGAASAAGKAAENILMDPVASTNVPIGQDQYTAVANDLVKQMLDGSLEKNQFIDEQIANLQKQKESMMAGMEEGNARILRDEATTTGRLTEDYNNQKAAMEYERAGTEGKMTFNNEVMRERNANLAGFIKAQLSVGGNLDGSASMEKIAKYTALSEMALHTADKDLADYSGMMLTKENELFVKYGQQLIDVQNGAEDAITKNKRQTYDQMLAIDSQVTKTETDKVDSKNQLLVQMNQIQSDAKSKAFNERQSIQAAALEESKFTFTKLQGQRDEDYRNKSYIEQIRQFNKTTDHAVDVDLSTQTGLLHVGGEIAMDPATNKPIKTLAGQSHDLQVDDWLTSVYGKVYKSGIDTGVVTAAQKNLNRNYDADVAGLRSDGTGDFYDPVTGQDTGQRTMAASSKDMEQQSANIDLIMKKVQAGIASPNELNQLRSAYNVMSQGTYVQVGGADGQKKAFSDVLAEAVGAAQGLMKNPAYQCVQFVRSALKDLPGGITSLQDKMNILVRGPNGIKDTNQMPNVGDVVVMDYGVKDNTGVNNGHVAIVSAVNPETGKFQVTQDNVTRANGHGTPDARWMDTTNGSIKGYWRSPSIGQSAPAATEGIKNATMGMSKEKAADYQKQYAAKIQAGDQDGADNIIQNAAIEKMDGPTLQEYLDYNGIANSSAIAMGTIDAFQGGNPGMYNKIIDMDMKHLVQLPKDSPYYTTVQSVMLPTQAYRQKIYGAALSKGDMKLAALAMPTDTDTLADMRNSIDGIRQYNRSLQQGLVDVSKGNNPTTNNQGLVDSPIGPIDPQIWRQMQALADTPGYTTTPTNTPNGQTQQPSSWNPFTSFFN